jgi:hypothetical protein
MKLQAYNIVSKHTDIRERVLGMKKVKAKIFLLYSDIDQVNSYVLLYLAFSECQLAVFSPMSIV